MRHVKLKDTAEAVDAGRRREGRPAAIATAGRSTSIWINGPNFLAMKEQGLLHGPFTQLLPNSRRVDTQGKPSTVIDFTVPVDGLAAPWRMAQIVSSTTAPGCRSRRGRSPRCSTGRRRNPGRLTHPSVRNFLGTTFLKQALYELAPDPAVLQQPGDRRRTSPR